MPSSGPRSPGTLANDNAVGTVAWSNPTNAASSNDSHAVAGFGANGTSNYLKATNFGFAIPASATVNGVEVAIERRCAGTITDSTVKLVKGGVVSGDNKASGSAWPVTDTVASYGGAADSWGVSLTGADVNAADFGVVLSVTGTAGGGGQVDHITITVTYTEAVAPLGIRRLRQARRRRAA